MATTEIIFITFLSISAVLLLLGVSLTIFAVIHLLGGNK